jgi:hypothetical protein
VGNPSSARNNSRADDLVLRDLFEMNMKRNPL